MKKMLLNILSGIALFSCTASAQSKIDTPVTYKEAFKKQEEAFQKQEVAAAKQEVLAKEQSEKAKEQSEKAKEQQEMMNTVKQEMLNDGLIKKDENYELTINSREMFINNKKQPGSVHYKYIELINSKRKMAFGEKEEWKVTYP